MILKGRYTVMLVPFDDEHYKDFMETKVKDWMQTTVQSKTLKSFDGLTLHYTYAIHPDAKAVIVMLHGFTEFWEKFSEVAYDFYDQGYSFVFLEQRGHGWSGRQVPKADLVHVNDFNDYVQDLKKLMDKVVSKIQPELPRILYSHSMGGAVSAMFLEQYPGYFKAAALSSPMLKISFGSVPKWEADILMVVAKLFHWKTKTLPNYTPFDPDHPDFENSCSTSRARFDYEFEMRLKDLKHYSMNGGTYQWCLSGLKETKKVRKMAASVKIPVLICQAGRDTMVDNSGQDEFASKAPNCTLVKFPNAKHEIYNCDAETLEAYYKTLFDFFGKYSGGQRQETFK